MSVSSGSAYCDKCGVGTYSDTDSRNCAKCPKGKISLGGVSACALCEAGKVADVIGSGSCRECQRGSIPEGLEACLKCPPGKFEAAKECRLCDPGRYSEETGQSLCSSRCPDFMTTIAGSVSATDCVCVSGHFNAEDIKSIYGTSAAI